MDGAAPLEVAELVAQRSVGRLCHLTPFRNLIHLVTERVGLLSLRQLADTAGDFDQQDLERLDRHPDHICCSIQYPNAWYLHKRRMQATPLQRLFPDWVCLTLSPRHIWSPGTEVCVRNAAAEGGSLIRPISSESFESLYASPVRGAQGREFFRTPNRIPASPTDDQAEVLVQRMVPIDDLQVIIVKTESDAKRFHAALDQLGADVADLRWAVAPTLFDRYALRDAIVQGTPPPETPWLPS